MDSPAQIDGGSSQPFWIVRLKNIIYEQKTFPRKLSHPKMFKNLPPDHISEWFLHHSDLKNPAQTARTIRVAQNSKIKSKSTQIFPNNVKSDRRLKKSNLCKVGGC